MHINPKGKLVEIRKHRHTLVVNEVLGGVSVHKTLRLKMLFKLNLN